MHRPTRRQWLVIGLLALYAVVAGVIVLSPVSYAGIVQNLGDLLRHRLGVALFGDGWIEFAANILMFVPLGFLLTIFFRHPWYGVVLALVLSAGVELAQIVIPSRQPSIRDVIANVLGAAVGAGLAWILVVRRERKRARSALEPR